MLFYNPATFATDGRLTLTARRHGVDWIPRQESGPWKVVAELRRRQTVYVTSLEFWAAARNAEAEEAEAEILALKEGVVAPPHVPQLWMAEAKRKGRLSRGSAVFTLQLPQAVCWWLTSGVVVGDLRHAHSLQVLVASGDQGAYIWGRPTDPLLDPGGLEPSEEPLLG